MPEIQLSRLRDTQGTPQPAQYPVRFKLTTKSVMHNSIMRWSTSSSSIWWPKPGCTGDDLESLSYQRAWAALVAADESIAAASAKILNDLAIGDYLISPPLVIRAKVTDEETTAAEDTWRIGTARLQQASDELCRQLSTSHSGQVLCFDGRCRNCTNRRRSIPV